MAFWAIPRHLGGAYTDIPAVYLRWLIRVTYTRYTSSTLLVVLRRSTSVLHCPFVVPAVVQHSSIRPATDLCTGYYVQAKLNYEVLDRTQYVMVTT